MSVLTQASSQWATRPADERYTNLYDMLLHFVNQREQSKEIVVSSRILQAEPDPDNKGLYVVTKGGRLADSYGGDGFAPTHWSFGQLASLADAPPGYLRKLPSPIAADCVNWGLSRRSVEDVGLLLHRNGSSTLKAATGPKYGRIWNESILKGMTKTFGDGVTGDWCVPGIMGKPVNVNKDNTTMFAGDRDMFVFLADEKNRIEVPGRRDGKSGLMARGFFVWNSEVGSSSFGVATFLFDYVCGNRMVWGATQFKELRMRHTAAAPDRFMEELEPALVRYSNSSAGDIIKGIEQAKKARLDDVEEFLSKRFSKKFAEELANTHVLEEGRPIESLWDVSVAMTAKARNITWQDERVALERKAGDIMDLAIK